jgi:hypothetical protein
MDEQMFIEDNFMSELEEKEVNCVWIGLMRFDSNDHSSDSFRWMNGSPLNFTFWHSVEPNNNGGMQVSFNINALFLPLMNLLFLQFCVALWGGHGQTGSWFDTTCDKKYLGLCEKPLKSLPALPMEKTKARSFDYAIKKQYTLLDDAYSQLHKTTIRIWMLGFLNLFLGLLLSGMIYFGDYSNGSLACIFPSRRTTRRQDTNNLVNPNYNPNNLTTIVNQESPSPSTSNSFSVNFSFDKNKHPMTKAEDANKNVS